MHSAGNFPFSFGPPTYEHPYLGTPAPKLSLRLNSGMTVPLVEMRRNSTSTVAGKFQFPFVLRDYQLMWIRAHRQTILILGTSPAPWLSLRRYFQSSGMIVPFVAQKDIYNSSNGSHAIAFVHPPSSGHPKYTTWSKLHLSSTLHTWRYYIFFALLIALVLISLTELPPQTHIMSGILTFGRRTI